MALLYMDPMGWVGAFCFGLGRIDMAPRCAVYCITSFCLYYYNAYLFAKDFYYCLVVVISTLDPALAVGVMRDRVAMGDVSAI